MIDIISKIDGKHVKLDTFGEQCWTHLTDPTPEEVEATVNYFGVENNLVCAALDDEESAHIDTEDDQTLVIVDIPVILPDESSFMYTTLPLGIVICPKGIITVCTHETAIIDDFIEGRVKTFSTRKKTRFLLLILYRNAARFLQYLKQVDKASSLVETELHKSMKNRELIQMLKLEKSLVYFSTSLKGNEMVLEKLMKTQAITLYPDDEDLLEDAIIENKQAIEMCTIYRDILSGTMDAYASVISNNLNIVMKLLAVVTILLSVPQIIFGLWGMNTAVPWEGSMTGFYSVIGISVGLVAAGTVLMWKKHMF